MSNLGYWQRHVGLILLVMMTAAGLAGCRQQEQPPAVVPQTQPAPATGPAAAQPATQTAPATTQAVRHFSVTSVGLKPDQPVSLLGKVEDGEPARVSAHLQTDQLLVMKTSNVSSLRIDLPNLPRRAGGRLVIQIDGQGLEVLGRDNKVVQLERNSVGNWLFTRPRP